MTGTIRNILLFKFKVYTIVQVLQNTFHIEAVLPEISCSEPRLIWDPPVWVKPKQMVVSENFNPVKKIYMPCLCVRDSVKNLMLSVTSFTLNHFGEDQ